ncbi:alpha/beta fold hydrolase [Micromonospora sp. NPDC051196]|uniref:alpha/beta hydrolase n=1 Tax=Micromonospora sp. NPDC051196 TaxID=3155281 RepID=UPI0034487373
MSTDRELAFDSTGHRLVGTLTLPDGPGPHPTALLLPGSGPLNRDGDHRRLRLGIQRELAAALAAAGVATLRYDRRGVGDSSGRFWPTGFHDNVDDAQAALAALDADADVDSEALFLVGHSEGALTATMLAARGVTTAGLVLLSSSARLGAEVLRWQTAQILPSLPAPVRLFLRLTSFDLVAKVTRNHEKILATTGDVTRIGGQRINAKWMREFLRYDPRPDLARIDAPILAVTGTKDLQVDPTDLTLIAEHAGGPVETRLLPDVTHVLRHQPGRASLGAYRREVRDPVDAAVTGAVVDWLRARVAELT